MPLVLQKQPILRGGHGGYHRQTHSATHSGIGGYHCQTHSPRTVVLVVTTARRIRHERWYPPVSTSIHRDGLAVCVGDRCRKLGCPPVRHGRSSPLRNRA